MRNIWLLRKELKKTFPVGRRIRVVGPFDILNETLLGKYIGEYGIVVDHMFQEFTYYSETFYVGVILDVNNHFNGNNTNWFTPSEIELYYEDYVC